MSRKIKELEKRITNMVENFDAKNFKTNALEEIKAIKKSTKKSTAFIEYIVDEYPDFNSITFSATQPNAFVIKISINVDELRGNKKAIHKAAKMVAQWLRAGGKVNE